MTPPSRPGPDLARAQRDGRVRRAWELPAAPRGELGGHVRPLAAWLLEAPQGRGVAGHWLATVARVRHAPGLPSPAYADGPHSHALSVHRVTQAATLDYAELAAARVHDGIYVEFGRPRFADSAAVVALRYCVREVIAGRLHPAIELRTLWSYVLAQAFATVR